jgi:cellulose synthase/poly-beta-1,6-N-acetylglucosamine synthase-like glycosyltransferase
MKEQFPEVAIVVAAYNEASCVIEKVQNCFELDYPAHKVKIHFVTDGSTDDTVYLLRQIDGVRVHHQDQRKGKLAAVERAMKFIDSPVVLLTDANCLLNRAALKKIVRHYENPHVGAVSGEKVIRKQTASSSASGEGFYWKYESWLKRVDSHILSVVGAAGEIFSFRRSLFEELPADTIIEDFVLSMRIAMKGYKVVYEPEALATEYASSSVREEWKRKVRICAGGFQSLNYLPGIWNPFQYGLLSILFLSHRYLRWSVIPFILPLLIIVSGILAFSSTLYLFIFILTMIVVTGAVAGLSVRNENKIPKVLLVPSYFLMMNAAAYVGLIRYWKGSQSAVWEKSKRYVEQFQTNL